MDTVLPENNSPAVLETPLEKLKLALVAGQQQIEDDFLAEVDLLMQCMLVAAYATSASEADYAAAFEMQKVPLNDIAHLVAECKPNALTRLRSGEEYKILQHASNTLVERLLQKFPVVIADSPPLTPATIVSLPNIEERIARRVADKDDELRVAISRNGLRCLPGASGEETLLDLKEFSIWAALNYFRLPPAMEQRCKLIIKFEQPSKVHARHASFSKNREDVLKAAVMVLSEQVIRLESGRGPSKALTARGVRDQIDMVWPHVFPDSDGSPPLAAEEIERLLGPLIKGAKILSKK